MKILHFSKFCMCKPAYWQGHRLRAASRGEKFWHAPCANPPNSQGTMSDNAKKIFFRHVFFCRVSAFPPMPSGLQNHVFGGQDFLCANLPILLGTPVVPISLGGLEPDTLRKLAAFCDFLEIFKIFVFFGLFNHTFAT